MKSATEELKELILKKRRLTKGRKIALMPTPRSNIRAVASETAKILDDRFEINDIRADENGRRYYRMLYREFIKLIGRDLTSYFREILKKFGYRLKIEYGSKEITIIKEP